jgi:hypothetical protein
VLRAKHTPDPARLPVVPMPRNRRLYIRQGIQSRADRGGRAAGRRASCARDAICTQNRINAPHTVFERGLRARRSEPPGAQGRPAPQGPDPALAAEPRESCRCGESRTAHAPADAPLRGRSIAGAARALGAAGPRCPRPGGRADRRRDRSGRLSHEADLLAARRRRQLNVPGRGGRGQDVKGLPTRSDPSLYASQPVQKPVVAASSARNATSEPRTAPATGNPAA